MCIIVLTNFMLLCGTLVCPSVTHSSLTLITDQQRY
jgi:hypothetical protein